MRDFRALKAWAKADAVALRVDRVLRRWPPRVYTHLASQLRRAADSVPTNIVEGCARDGPREFAHFLQIALASATELEYHLIRAADRRLVSRTTYLEIMDEVKQTQRMLTVFIQRLRGRRVSSTPPANVRAPGC